MFGGRVGNKYSFYLIMDDEIKNYPEKCQLLLIYDYLKNGPYYAIVHDFLVFFRF